MSMRIILGEKTIFVHKEGGLYWYCIEGSNEVSCSPSSVTELNLADPQWYLTMADDMNGFSYDAPSKKSGANVEVGITSLIDMIAHVKSYLDID